MTTSKDPAVANGSASVPHANSDFSIEHILTKAGNRNPEYSAHRSLPQQGLTTFSWLQCTRYCPPKLPRSQKKEGPQRRQLGRHPRIPFSGQQLAVLEEKFKKSPYLSSAEVTQLSRKLQLADIRVKIWFQNRRARERRERNEQETKQLKSQTHDTKLKFSPEPYGTPLPPTTLPSTHTNVNSFPSNESFLQPTSPNSNNCTSPILPQNAQRHLDFQNIIYFFDPKHP